MKEYKYILIGSLLILTIFVSGCLSGNASADNDGEYITIPLSDLSDEVQFYTIEDGGVDINYFVVLGSNSEPRTAFDACDVCGGSKGYMQTGTDITCKNCGKVFRIDGLGTQNKGYGCWPSYLPHTINGDNLLIKISDIKDGKHRFA
jgi:uncharacterized membrane protein